LEDSVVQPPEAWLSVPRTAATATAAVLIGGEIAFGLIISFFFPKKNISEKIPPILPLSDTRKKLFFLRKK